MKRRFDGSAELAPRILFVAGAILIGTLIVALVAESLFHRETPVPVNGELDLRNWDFSSSPSLPLGGTWSFEPERLLTSSEFGQRNNSGIRRIPDTRFDHREAGFFSGTGSGTYRLVVLLPQGKLNLGLRFSTVWTAFEAEANGIVVERVGTPGLTASQSAPGFGAGVVGLGPTGERLELLVRVSNHEYRWGGIVRPFVLGAMDSLTSQKRRDDTMVFLMVGALLGVGGNSLFLFAYRRRDPVYLSFAAFAMTVALRAVTSGDNLILNLLPGLGFDAFIRLGFTSQYLLIPTAAVFFHRLFPEDIPRTRLLWFLLPSSAFCLLLPFGSVSVLSWSLLPYAVVALGQAAYGYVAVCLRPAMKRRPGAAIVLAAGTVLLAAILLNVRNEVVFSRAESGFPLDLMAFVIVQSLVMAKRFTWAFEKNESLTDELQVANRQLMEEARAAEEARDLLQEAVAEKSVLLREVHHRVKNSLQIVLSIISLQVRRTTDPGALAAYGSMRDRIRAISSVHDRLFGLESEKRIDLQDYAGDLLQHLAESYGDGAPFFHFESDPIQVPMDLCLEVGLILTELMINACRHAHAPVEGGPIRVNLRRNDRGIVLTVADSGPGFPEGFLPESVGTVGFKIIGSLVTPRKGTVGAFNRAGAVVEVFLPVRDEPANFVYTA